MEILVSLLQNAKIFSANRVVKFKEVVKREKQKEKQKCSVSYELNGSAVKSLAEKSSVEMRI